MKSIESDSHLIKKQLHAQIDRIQDADFLGELENLIQSRLGQAEPYTFNDAQLAAIKESEEQVARGEVFSHDQVMAETEQWLKES